MYCMLSVYLAGTVYAVPRHGHQHYLSKSNRHLHSGQDRRTRAPRQCHEPITGDKNSSTLLLAVQTHDLNDPAFCTQHLHF